MIDPAQPHAPRPTDDRVTPAATPPSDASPAGSAPRGRPRIALAHDWLCGYRGGEAVLDALIEAAQQIGDVIAIYTMFSDERALTQRIDALPHRIALLGRLPGANRARRWLLPLFPLAAADLSRQLRRDHDAEPIDLLISTSSAAIKSMAPPAGVPHLCYIHAPARYLWTLTGEYSRGSPLRALGFRLFGERLRSWDRETASRVDLFIANSGYTAAQVEKHYMRHARTLHPPVDTDFFTPGPEGTPRAGWLVASALEPYKRVDLAIAAARAAGRRLTVIGDGSEAERLRSLAGPDIEFRGRVSRESLRDAYRTAELFLFPQIEDFGIAAVESLACGTPVAAYAAGGAIDILGPAAAPIGVLIETTDPEAFAAAASRSPSPTDPAVARACRSRAEHFDRQRFLAAARDVIAEMLVAKKPARASGPR